jgi:hypothetical protein
LTLPMTTHFPSIHPADGKLGVLLPGMGAVVAGPHRYPGMKRLRRTAVPLTAPRGFLPPTLAVLATLVSLAPLGCATTVQPGLANAPSLSTTPVADANVHDVVANGPDSCEGRLGPGPLRYQFPPCPGVERRALPPAAVGVASPEKGIVLPWEEHHDSRPPCSFSENDAKRVTLGNPGALYSASDRGLILTCVGPL